MTPSPEVRELVKQLWAVIGNRSGQDTLYALSITLGSVIVQAPASDRARQAMARQALGIMLDMINQKGRQQ